MNQNYAFILYLKIEVFWFNIILDTNVYGEIIKEGMQNQLKQRLDVLKNDIIVYGVEIIRKELRAVPKDKKSGKHNLRVTLLELYDHLIKNHDLEISELARTLSRLYFDIYKKRSGTQDWKSIKNDFLIVAEATIKKMDIIVTDDEKTMHSARCMKIYNKINKENNLITPNFINYEDFKNKLV